MDSNSPEFEWYDAWVLAAVIYAMQGTSAVPLWRLISVADALNKAIVSRAELELALTRLDRAGYIRAVSTGFEATPEALALKIAGPPVQNIARAIGAKPWSQSAQTPRAAEEVYVSADSYAKAVKEYRKEARRERQGRQ